MTFDAGSFYRNALNFHHVREALSRLRGVESSRLSDTRGSRSSRKKVKRDGNRALGRKSCTYPCKKFAAKYRAFNCNYNRRSSSKRFFPSAEEINWISCCYLFWSVEYAQELPWIIEYHGERVMEEGGSGGGKKARSGASRAGEGGWS